MNLQYSVVDTYIERYDWQLIEREDFVCLLQDQCDQHLEMHACRNAVLCIYSKALYQACSGAEGSDRQDRAYHELAAFLHRIALQRYHSVFADATQHALECVYRNFANCRQPETFLAFALQQLRNAARSELRSLHKMGESLSSDGDLEESSVPLAMHEANPIDIALQNDVRTRLAAYARGFLQAHPRSANQLLALWLGYIHGLDIPTIAKRLNKSVAAIHVLRSRGIVHLRSDPAFRALATELGLIPPIPPLTTTPISCNITRTHVL